MPQIQQLPAHIADLIAAGEVVERPASVMKELLENAIDAGASAIVAEIEHGGLTYIRITDNGCGIPAEQLPTAFLRHATSKLRRPEDLAAIGIDMTIKQCDWNVFLQERKNGNFDFCREGWLADFNDPINMLEMWIPTSGNNDCQFGK